MSITKSVINLHIFLLGADSTGRICIWNMKPVLSSAASESSDSEVPKLLSQMDHHLGCVNCLRWSGSGEMLASGGDDKLVRIKFNISVFTVYYDLFFIFKIFVFLFYNIPVVLKIITTVKSRFYWISILLIIPVDFLMLTEFIFSKITWFYWVILPWNARTV